MELSVAFALAQVAVDIGPGLNRYHIIASHSERFVGTDAISFMLRARALCACWGRGSDGVMEVVFAPVGL